MAPTTSFKKRPHSDVPTNGRPTQRPLKKRKQQRGKQRVYHSDSDSDEAEKAENGKTTKLTPAADHDNDDEEEDLDNMVVDDGASTGEDDDSHGEDDDADTVSDASHSQHHGGHDTLRQKPRPANAKPKQPPVKAARDAPEGSPSALKDGAQPNNGGEESEEQDEDDEDDDDEEEDEDEDDSDGDDDAASVTGSGGGPARQKKASRRNDAAAFALSMSKMLSAKTSASRRADPIVARSAESAAARRGVADAALEARARKRMREQRRLALEKGRVRDVLVAQGGEGAEVVGMGGKEGGSAGGGGGGMQGEKGPAAEETATAEMLAAERRLRKVAQRGVVKLFNAVRAAHVKAAEAERAALREGTAAGKKERVSEMSRKGFLDLIARGGGALKKGPLEEA